MASVEIEAPIHVVWQVMTDFAAYNTWNPFVHDVDVDGEGVGGRLALHVRFPNGRTSYAREQITRWEPPAEGGACLAYRYRGRGRFLGMVHAVRTQRLTGLGEARCRYESVEPMGGRLRLFLPMAQVKAGTAQHAKALKARAEALYAARD